MTDKPRPLPVARMVADAGRVLSAVAAGDCIPAALAGDLAIHVLAPADALERPRWPGKAGDGPGGKTPAAGPTPGPGRTLAALNGEPGDGDETGGNEP